MQHVGGPQCCGQSEELPLEVVSKSNSMRRRRVMSHHDLPLVR